MTPKRRYNLFLEERQIQGLRQIKVRDGVSESEQIRRAIDAWLKRKGVKTERPRVRKTRERS